MKKLIFVIILLLVIQVNTKACSCIEHKPITGLEVKETDKIFIGKVISIEKIEAFGLKVIFKVKSNFKGCIDSSKVSIYTSLNTAICGIDFMIGEKWFIFSKNYNGQSFASLCSRSVRLNKPNISTLKNNQKAIAFVKEKYAKDKLRLEADISFIKAN